MAAIHLSPVYNAFVDFVVQKATPNEVLAFKLPASTKRRAIELLERSNAGTLTPEEALELEQMQQIDRLVSVLKARALETAGRQ